MHKIPANRIEGTWTIVRNANTKFITFLKYQSSHMIKESDGYSQVTCSLVRGISQRKYPIRKTIWPNPSFLRQRKLLHCQNYSKNKLQNNKISLIGRLPLFCHFTATTNDTKLKGLWALLWKSPSYSNYSPFCLKAICKNMIQRLETSRQTLLQYIPTNKPVILPPKAPSYFQAKFIH